MDAQEWNRVQEIFEAALDVAPEQRDVFLAEACRNDPDLLKEVTSLLRADSQGHTLFDGLAIDAIGLPDEILGIGELIGPYRILRPIGEGGMGTVYLAERADGQFEQRVALKLIKPGMDSVSILKRFQSERQILARLQHPHIARLLDGGMTTPGSRIRGGIPYFAMEYIDGLPIDRYCDKHQLGVDRRLDLFTRVCRAVQFAHQNLVVHRDLKPDNILVDQQGEVKLLDFGIAKVLEDHSEGTTLTRPGMHVMTPEYAAPEQIQGHPVTTATDVYALGVVLYELLTGRRPHQVDQKRRKELEQLICFTEPVKPSTAVTEASQKKTITQPAKQRSAPGLRPDRLRRRLSGDLDTICLKALRKEPERRYASAEAFLEDIRRHLNGLPITAQPDRLGYRVRKFVQRHRVGVLTAAGVVLLVGLLIGFYTARLAQERDRARIEAEKAAQVAQFLQGLFEVSDPDASKGEEITARSLLDEGAHRIRMELADQPEVQADMMNVMGRVYRSLGLFNEAATLVQDALSIREEQYGPAHADVAESVHDLGEMYRAMGTWDRADSLHQMALDMRITLFGDDHPVVAQSLNNVASLRRDQGRYAQADSLFRRALSIRRTRLGDTHLDVSETLTDLAFLLNDQGKYDEAEPLYREALAITREHRGELSQDVLSIEGNLGTLLYDLGRYDEAEVIQREVLEKRRVLLGDEHPSLAVSLSNLALVLQDKGDYAEAERFYRETLEMDRKIYGEDHQYIAGDLGNLGTVLYDQGRYDEAEPYYVESLKRKLELFGRAHPGVANGINNMGFLRQAQGQLAEAERRYREVLDILDTLEIGDHPYRAGAFHNLAQVRYEGGDLVGAEGYFQEALAIRQRIVDPDHPHIAYTLTGLGYVKTGQQAYARADSLFQTSLLIQRENLPSAHVQTARTLIGLGALRMAQGHPEEAEPYLQEAWAMRQETLPETHWQRAEVMVQLATSLMAQQKYTEAESLLRDGYARLKAQRGEQNPHTRRARTHLLHLYQQWGKPVPTDTFP